MVVLQSAEDITKPVTPICSKKFVSQQNDKKLYFGHFFMVIVPIFTTEIAYNKHSLVQCLHEIDNDCRALTRLHA